MFLCNSCHTKINCSRALIEDLGLHSRGGCESCHRSAVCVDCHGVRGAAKSSAPARKPYATTGEVSRLLPARGAYGAAELGYIKGDDGREYQFASYGRKNTPQAQNPVLAIGDRVRFAHSHIGGVGAMDPPLATALVVTRKAVR
jgi:hypothetical protein